MNLNHLLFTFFISIGLGLFCKAQQGLVWQEDFGDPNLVNNLPTGWTWQDVSEWYDDVGQEINVAWKRCEIQSQCAPYVNNLNLIRDFQSSTASNGYVYASPMDHPPLSNNQGLYSTILQSPIIELDNNNSLFLQFESFLGTFQQHEYEGTSLQVKVDQQDWSDQIKIYPNLPDNGSLPQETTNANRLMIDLNEFSGANTIQFRWLWSGHNEWLWCLDDIKLWNQNPLHISAIWHGGNFDGGANGWTVNQLEGDCSWQWQEWGSYSEAFIPSENKNKFINSWSAYNGAMIINADYCLINENPNPQFPLPIQISELISPTIDLSAIDQQPILRFYQTAHLYSQIPPDQPAVISWSYSVDNGASWSNNIPLDENIAINHITHEERRIIMPPVVMGKDQVKIKFTFAGPLFFWVIDDVAIIERPVVDMAISGNFYTIATNAITPVSQIEPQRFLLDIENMGSQTIQNVLVEVTVKDFQTNNIIFQTQRTVYQSIEPLEIVENILFQDVFFPPEITGKYIAQYEIITKNDETPQNNKVSYEFEYSESVFAKESGGEIGFKPPNSSYKWGNIFYIPHGEDFKVDKVFFKIENITQLSNLEVIIELYQWNSNSEGDLVANSDEIDLLDQKSYTILGTETEGIFITFDQIISLQNQATYILVVSYNRTNVNQPQCFLSTSVIRDYLATVSNSIEQNNPRYASAVDNNLEGEFQIVGVGNGSGFDYIPVIRLFITEETNILNHSVAFPLTTFPNPSYEQEFYIQIDEKGLYHIILKNNSGQIVNHCKVLINDETYNYQLPKNLPTATYYIELHNLSNFKTYLTKQIVLNHN